MLEKQDWVAFMSHPYWVDVEVEIEAEVEFNLRWGWCRDWGWDEVELKMSWGCVKSGLSLC